MKLIIVWTVLLVMSIISALVFKSAKNKDKEKISKVTFIFSMLSGYLSATGYLSFVLVKIFG